MKFLFAILFILCLISFSSEQKHVPKIQVYIESLCPDCYNFIVGSFKDFYEKVKRPNLAQIEFIPYGNAKEEYNTQTKKWEFTCQHGEPECYGNLIETCAIQKMGRVNSYSAILCLESNIEEYDFDFDKTLEFCFKEDQTTLDEIKACVSSDMGNLYEHQMAQKTESHFWVPWVVVDGVHDIDVENQILESLIDYVCGDDKSKCYN
jgi:interferon gamma-inducible protein 30